MTGVQPAVPRLRAVLEFLVVFLGAVQVFALALSVGKIRLNQSGALFILVVASALAFVTSRRPKEESPERAARKGGSLFSLPLCRSLLVLTFTMLGVLAMVAYFTEDFSYDGNSYHIPPINQWAIKGFIHDVDPAFDNSRLMNGYPKGAEAVTFVFVEALGSKFLNVLNLFYAPLGFLGIALLCHLFGATIRDSLVFGVIYLLVPANVVQYGSTYVDAALGSAVIALLALLASNLVTDGRSWLTEAVPIGCAIGNVIAIKSTGLLIVTVSLVSFLAWGVKGTYGFRRRVPALLLLTSLGMVYATAVGGYWYVRNYVGHGSPLYPYGLAVAGHTIWPGETIATYYSAEVAEPMLRRNPGLLAADSSVLSRNTPEELRAMSPVRRIIVSWIAPVKGRPWSYSWPGRFADADTRLGALGALWVLGCIPALLACAYLLTRGSVDDPHRRVIYYFLATSVLLSFFGTPLNWWGRYTVWVFALGLPSMWLVLNQSQHFSSGLRRSVQSWAAVCISLLILRAAIIVVVACVYPVAELKPGKYRVPTFVLRSEHPLLPLFPEMRSRLLAEMLHTETVVGVGPRALGKSTETIYGQLSIPIGRRNLIPVPADVTEGEVRRFHSEAHLNYILWLTSSPVPSPLAAHVRTRGSEGPFTYLELIADSYR